MKKLRSLASGAGIAFLIYLSTARLAAQDDPTPKEPIIPRAPDLSAWTITYRYKPDNSDPKPAAGATTKPPDQINSVQVQKTGKIYHRIINWSSGAQTDAWNIGQRQVSKDKSARTYALMPGEGPATDDYSKSDFDDLAWINMKNYTGYKKGEQPVFVFQVKNTERPMTRREKFNPAFMYLLQSAPTDVKTPSDSASASPAKLDRKSVLEQIYGDTTATVVLDAKTQLPIAYDDGKTTWAYQFTTPPLAPLVPPPEVVKILRHFDDYVKGVAVHPSAP